MIKKKISAIVMAGLIMAGTFLGNNCNSVEAKENWKAIYQNYLNQNDWVKEESAGGRFIYVDKDNIPEIFLEGSCAASGNKLLSINNGKVEESYLDGYGAMYYVKKKNRIYMIGGHMDEYFDAFGRLKDGKIEVKYSGNYGAENNADVKWDKNGEPVYQYFWEEKQVSKGVYNKTIKKYKGNYKYKESYIYGKMDSIEQLKEKLR